VGALCALCNYVHDDLPDIVSTVCKYEVVEDPEMLSSFFSLIELRVLFLGNNKDLTL